MSGDIWCIIFDPIVRCLVAALGGLDACVSAFADDLGLPCSDLFSCLKRVVPVVDRIGLAAGLFLNWKKTVFVNLSVFSEFELRRRIEQVVPVAATAKICEAARYLGFLTGPCAHEHSWVRPCKRLLERARHVRSLGLSLFETVLAFNVFAVSWLPFHFPVGSHQRFCWGFSFGLGYCHWHSEAFLGCKCALPPQAPGIPC